jgi:hypothetical protein
MGWTVILLFRWCYRESMQGVVNDWQSIVTFCWKVQELSVQLESKGHVRSDA